LNTENIPMKPNKNKDFIRNFKISQELMGQIQLSLLEALFSLNQITRQQYEQSVQDIKNMYGVSL
jgi:SUMO ligase MMS21 Smc5/6 complex component